MHIVTALLNAIASLWWFWFLLVVFAFWRANWKLKIGWFGWTFVVLLILAIARLIL